MDGYIVGAILGSIMQPSTLIAFVLALFFKRKRKSLLAILIIIICFIQWVSIKNMGGGILGIGSLIIPIITGLLVAMIVSSFKK